MRTVSNADLSLLLAIAETFSETPCAVLTREVLTSADALGKSLRSYADEEDIHLIHGYMQRRVEDAQ